MPPYVFDTSQGQYYDRGASSYLTETDLINASRTITDGHLPAIDAIAADWASGDEAARGVTERIEGVLKNVYPQQYVLGKGGRNNMNGRDWFNVRQARYKQREFLRGFRAWLRENPDASEARVRARARMYVEGSHAVFEQGRAASHGTPDLSQYPGDGQTVCLSHCKCYLTIDRVDGGWNVRWNRTIKESCPDCIEMANKWNPLFIPDDDERGLQMIRAYADNPHDMMGTHHH